MKLTCGDEKHNEQRRTKVGQARNLENPTTRQRCPYCGLPLCPTCGGVGCQDCGYSDHKFICKWA